MKTLSPKALGLSLAVLGALSMLVMSLLALAGLYTEAYSAMQSWHIFADLTFVGILLGMLEAAVWSYVTGALVAVFYNKFV